MKSWKIGAIAGLIAGIFAGIVAAFILVPMLFKLGLPYYSLPQPPDTPFIKIGMTEIILTTIWGILLGIIYSRIHNLIPGKGILKGLIFGLGWYFILNIRWVIFSIPYGYLDNALSQLLFISPIIYGIVLAILYKTPKEKFEIKKRKIIDGVIPGVITGLIFSLLVIIGYVVGAYTGIIFSFMETYPDYLSDIEFIIYQYMNHAWVNMFLMGIYGAIYAMFYDNIPGKGLIKGSIFGLIIWSIIDLQTGLYYLMYGSLSWALTVGIESADLYIFFGLVLEGLYKKRSRAFLIAGAVAVVYIIRTAIFIVLS
jgi:hypothetical protein